MTTDTDLSIPDDGNTAAEMARQRPTLEQARQFQEWLHRKREGRVRLNWRLAGRKIL